MGLLDIDAAAPGPSPGAAIAAASGRALIVGTVQYAVGGVMGSILDAMFPEPNVDAPTAAIAAEMGLQVAGTSAMSLAASALLVDTIDPHNVMGGMMFFLATAHSQTRLAAKAGVMWDRFAGVALRRREAAEGLDIGGAVFGTASGVVAFALVRKALDGGSGVLAGAILGSSAAILGYNFVTAPEKPLTVGV
jgi:hypothetical protein